MRWLPPMWVLFVALVGALLAQPAVTKSAVHFQAVDIFIDSKQETLAAYQLEFSVKSGDAKVVGVEGGEHPAFQEAPFYDPIAMQQERVIIAAFNTSAADKLPKGRTRVATIHLEISDERKPEFSLKLETAATANGNRVPVETTCEERKAK